MGASIEVQPERDEAPRLDKQIGLADDLEQQINELADIIVEFYREWKEQ